ncbi:MAG: hypothetical protein COV74_08175 [Candidatus Omnitrophica bacterium CG11_big_fil_rev_8_21_14_0_20_45_26]|uniref:DUF2007 domain-containing protein n=1 Tax=Candidatus Abzuiibacterium crystallinum TaxID=1974748 RepID=A0A2H0LMA1_9BACT|nr:MAG: hypothetical protein COV74_08175 [Candidatus Omnitrophica bacterium CG11_big_fil_rev_8_21_14_0_20_45_26]PIW64018.1 MAG: hypothetical protein COW12_07865 [Candidatus Omnitrophica bacterium CG12_big_fil_rev_8_21_14_0_65_45_16]
MRMIFIYLAIFIAVYAAVSILTRRKIEKPADEAQPSRGRFRSKAEKGPWVQVYDTDAFEDAQGVLARLQEEEIECCLYEQGRKDVHGNPLKGFGIAVPRSSTPRAQNLISRMPV